MEFTITKEAKQGKAAYFLAFGPEEIFAYKNM